MGAVRALVLGGTSFLSRAVAAETLRRGHEVVCAARRRAGTVPDGARLVTLDRDEPDALRPLAGQRFDAVVDVATLASRWVRDALHALAADAGHWTFVSSINVYADTATPHQAADAAVLEPVTEGGPTALSGSTPEYSGGVKVACENAVRDATGDRAFLVRPGLITGPGDYTDRFGYWPGRMHRGGRVVVPDVPEQPVQHIDVRDLATWIVDAGEQRLGGVFDAVGPVLALGATLREIAGLVGPAGTEAAGLPTRPLADTVHAALAEERARGLDRPRTAGLTPAEEAALLA